MIEGPSILGTRIECSGREAQGKLDCCQSVRLVFSALLITSSFSSSTLYSTLLYSTNIHYYYTRTLSVFL